MERHPGANKVLLMIGTNDAPSVDPGEYSSTLQTMANTITNGYKKQLWIAKPPPTYLKDTWTPNTAKNDVLSLYNQKISEITASPYDDIYLGPNYFTQFYQSLYADNLHPNDAGYRFMANEWQKKLP